MILSGGLFSRRFKSAVILQLRLVFLISTGFDTMNSSAVSLEQ